MNLFKAFIKEANFGLAMLMVVLAIGFAYLALPVFGHRALIVRTGSMQPIIGVGDLISVRAPSTIATPQDVALPLFHAGDIIAFKDATNSKVVITHRIAEVVVKNNKVFYETKGDANNAKDPNLVSQENVIGRADYGVAAIGRLIAFTRTKVGLLSLLIFPAALVILIESVNLVSEMKKSRLLLKSPQINGAFATKALVGILAVLLFVPTTKAMFLNSGTSTGNVFSAEAVFPTPTPSPSPTPPPIAQTLVMNELLPHSSCSSGNTEGQFLELWNGTSGTVNLKDFKLSDGTNTVAISNSNTNLASHAFAILVKSNGVINSCVGNIHGAISVNLGGTINLNVGTLRLLDSGNAVVDTILWGSSPNPQPLIDQSIERNPTGLDSALGINFAPSDFVVRTTPTPGQ